MAEPPPYIWELPDALVFHIVSYVAGPSHRETIICHTLGPLCLASSKVFLNESSELWLTLLACDYETKKSHDNAKRSSKRLRQSNLQRVREAHLMVRNNTEIAFHFLGEACAKSGKEKLSHGRLCKLFEEYGPRLRINHVTEGGGTFLVECCRARHVRESDVLKCVKELVERRGADVDLATNEVSPNKLTALCVASARGMPRVVRYLLDKGASPHIRCTGRFRLHSRPRKTTKCANSTALMFSQTIKNAEKDEGASERDLRNLNRCVSLLQNHDKT